jgi:hypothetical protein
MAPEYVKSGHLSIFIDLRHSDHLEIQNIRENLYQIEIGKNCIDISQSTKVYMHIIIFLQFVFQHGCIQHYKIPINDRSSDEKD